MGIRFRHGGAIQTMLATPARREIDQTMIISERSVVKACRYGVSDRRVSLWRQKGHCATATTKEDSLLELREPIRHNTFSNRSILHRTGSASALVRPARATVLAKMSFAKSRIVEIKNGLVKCRARIYDYFLLKHSLTNSSPLEKMPSAGVKFVLRAGEKIRV
ncbi:MAG: hypothetical protein ACREEM_28800 [Blastocatellia bacterium]